MRTKQLPVPLVSEGLGVNEFTFGLLGAAILIFGAVLWSARGPNVEKTDFSLIYVGATIVHEGLGSRLYDITLQKQIRNTLFAHPNPLFFEHPPFEAAFFSPFARLPFRTAYLIWGCLNATIWISLIFVMRPFLPSPREDLGYIALWLLFAPLGIALYQGQSSLILLALYAGTFVLLARDQEFVAGSLLGFGVFKFQFILPFALIFLLRKKWSFLAGMICSALVLGIVSVATTGWKGIAQYANFVLAIGTSPGNISYGSAVDMPTIQGFVYATIGRRIGHMAFSALVVSLTIALLFWVARSWKAGNPAMYAAAIAASLLSGSHMFTHDFSPLILALFIAVTNLRAVSHRSRPVLLSTLLLFWFPPMYFVLVATHLLYLMCPVLFLFVVSVALATQRYGVDAPFGGAGNLSLRNPL